MIVKRLLTGGQRVDADGKAALPERYYVNGEGLTDVSVMAAVDTVTGLTVPAHNSVHPDEGLSNYTASTIEADLIGYNEHGPQYLVDVGYRTSQYSGGGGGTPGGDPTFGYEWDARTENIQTNADVDGHPIVNAAGVPFEGAFDASETITILRIYGQEVFDPVRLNTVVNHVNAEAITVLGREIAGRQMICRSYKPLKRLIRGQEGFPVDVEYVFEFRNGYKPWDHHALNQGFVGFSPTLGFGGRFRVKDDPDFIESSTLLDDSGFPISADIRVGRKNEIPSGNPGIDDITRDDGDEDDGSQGWMEWVPAGGGAFEAVAHKFHSADFATLLPTYFGTVPPDDGVDP